MLRTCTASGVSFSVPSPGVVTGARCPCWKSPAPRLHPCPLPTRCSASSPGTRTGSPAVADALRFACRSRRFFRSPTSTSSPATSRRDHFFAGVRDRRPDRAGLRHARRVLHLHLFHNEPKKIHGDGRSGQPVPGPQRRPHRTPPPAQVSSRASARWRAGRASPSGTPSGRVPIPFAGRFRVPSQTPPGSIPSLCRSPESFVVCSSIFSHFYARRRFLSHRTHLWCPGQQARECHEPPCLAATGHDPLLPERHAPSWRHGVFHRTAFHPVEIQWFPEPRILPGTRNGGAVALNVMRRIAEIIAGALPGLIIIQSPFRSPSSSFRPGSDCSRNPGVWPDPDPTWSCKLCGTGLESICGFSLWVIGVYEDSIAGLTVRDQNQ